MRANLKNNKSDQRIAESFEDSSSGGSSDFGESSSLPCLAGDKTNFRSRIYCCERYLNDSMTSKSTAEMGMIRPRCMAVSVPDWECILTFPKDAPLSLTRERKSLRNF
jgi:hypothetical protein